MDKSHGFNDNTFTFRVGPSKKSFLVHADIVSRHSRVLHRLVEGAFKESIEKYADLPEVEPEIFGHFLAYAYSMSSGTSDNETTIQPSSTQRTSLSRLIELLLANGHKKFKCKSCYRTPELKFSLSFPRCGECDQDELEGLRWRNNCIVFDCSGNGEYIQGLLCGNCLKKLNVLNSYGSRLEPSGARKLQLGLPRSLEELQSFHFDIPLRMKEILGATKDFSAIPCPTSASLPDTARLAVFADIYEIGPLVQAALMALYQKLTQESLDEESIGRIIELTNFVYDNTPSSFPDGSSKGTHVLRRILSEFIAIHRVEFTASRTFMRLLCQEGS